MSKQIRKTLPLLCSLVLFGHQLNAMPIYEGNRILLDQCSVSEMKDLKRRVALAKGQWESTEWLHKSFSEMNQEAEFIKKISSSIAIVSATAMAFGNIALTANLIRGASLTGASRIMSLPISMQIQSATRIFEITKRPFLLLGREGLEAIGHISRLGVIEADKAAAIAQGMINFFHKRKTVQINVNSIYASEIEYQKAIDQLKDFRYQYMEENEFSPLENGLSFGRKAAAYTEDLAIITLYEKNLTQNLYEMKKARYLIHEFLCTND